MGGEGGWGSVSKKDLTPVKGVGLSTWHGRSGMVTTPSGGDCRGASGAMSRGLDGTGPAASP